MAIAARDGGLEIGLDVLNMRLFSKRSDNKPIEIEEKETGRELLSLVNFEKKRNREAHTMAEIVRKCLVSPIDDPLMEQLFLHIHRDKIVIH